MAGANKNKMKRKYQISILVLIILCYVLTSCTSVVVRVSASSDPTDSPTTARPSSQPQPSGPESIDQGIGENPDVTDAESRRAEGIQPPGPCQENNFTIPSVRLRMQETISWCWAASAQMVMEAIPGDFSGGQCDIVGNVLDVNPPKRCCPPPETNKTSEQCLQTGWPESALAKHRFAAHKVNFTAPPHLMMKPLTMEDQICNKQIPIILAETYPWGTGHTSVIGGIKKTGNGPDDLEVKLYNHDPHLLHPQSAGSTISTGPTGWMIVPYSELPLLPTPQEFRDSVSFYTNTIKIPNSPN